MTRHVCVLLVEVELPAGGSDREVAEALDRVGQEIRFRVVHAARSTGARVLATHGATAPGSLVSIGGLLRAGLLALARGRAVEESSP